MKYTREQIHTLTVLGYLAARKNIRNHLRPLQFEISQEINTYKIANDLYRRTYVPRPFDCFMINDPTLREVFAPNIDDAIESHILFDLVEPLFDKTFIADSYSCREGRGVLYGIERFEHHIRSCTRNYTRPAYILNIDISGYFMSINKGILYSIICNTFEKYKHRPTSSRSHHTWDDILDFDFLDYLVRLELFSNPLEHCRMIGNLSLRKLLPENKSMFFSPLGTGVTIGRVTNQLNSNIYMNEFDQWAKRTMKAEHYCRYVDDARIISTDIVYLEEFKAAAAEFLKDRLKLNLHPKKTNIISSDDTCMFLGAALRNYRRYAANKTVARYLTMLHEAEKHVISGNYDILALQSALNSYLGYFSHFNEKKLLKVSLSNSPLNEIFGFTKGYRKATIKKK